MKSNWKLSWNYHENEFFKCKVNILSFISLKSQIWLKIGTQQINESLCFNFGKQWQSGENRSYI